jgi:3D (Asp-Asp-Asp) domain-containing protein
MKNKRHKDRYLVIGALSLYSIILLLGAIGATNLYLKKINKQKNESAPITQNSEVKVNLATNSENKTQGNNQLVTKTDVKEENNTVKNKSNNVALTPEPESKSEAKPNVKSKAKPKTKPNEQEFSKKSETKKEPIKTDKVSLSLKKESSDANNVATTFAPIKSTLSSLSSLVSWVPNISKIKLTQDKPKEPNQKPVLKIKEPKQEHSLTKLKDKENLKKKASKHPDEIYTTKKILARVTVYWAYGSGTDHWSAKKQSSTGTRLECGKHAAVDPKVIPYGSKMEVQKNGAEVLVKAVDTGSAVKARKAAIAMAKNEEQKKAPVIDLFFERKSDALNYAKTNPAYQWVDVHVPKKSITR